ncbi:hypothetical protein COCSADRAFT_234953 [Bipolaris sorokiniana ND90Pr]|uniref:Uncharacterized protein n=1 Tax=Cochliobolus sativus (strain ND90Pr / ATCC 201652) TaxID=665912 RepID=M2R3E4_COCSN|nr:uncharacterized protein COCSADRAFT_234953 [Bipolaris sorokiniana ND90Pr]EMD61729.1 hypothetical protein COCSADRAFT_234953 [Bipolaris sorokiniana ND90Pr]
MRSRKRQICTTSLQTLQAAMRSQDSSGHLRISDVFATRKTHVTLTLASIVQHTTRIELLHSSYNTASHTNQTDISQCRQQPLSQERGAQRSQSVPPTSVRSLLRHVPTMAARCLADQGQSTCRLGHGTHLRRGRVIGLEDECTETAEAEMLARYGQHLGTTCGGGLDVPPSPNSQPMFLPSSVDFSTLGLTCSVFRVSSRIIENDASSLRRSAIGASIDRRLSAILSACHAMLSTPD